MKSFNIPEFYRSPIISRLKAIRKLNEAGIEVARGIVNYNSNDASRIKRKSSSSEIEQVLGFVEESELIHRDNLIILE